MAPIGRVDSVSWAAAPMPDAATGCPQGQPVSVHTNRLHKNVAHYEVEQLVFRIFYRWFN
jgi:hypothetical protein